MEVHVSQLDGTEDYIYRTGELALLNWTADSQQLVFSSFETHSHYLGKIGGGLVPLTEPLSYSENLSWLDSGHSLISTV